jgi:hypothetical protein
MIAGACPNLCKTFLADPANGTGYIFIKLERRGPVSKSEKKSKLETKRELLWCECECANCDIGAHERCHSPKCHMPKWKDVQAKAPKRDR